jgi:transcription antitermination factor NusG
VRNAGWDIFCPREVKWRPSTLRRQPVEARYPRYPGYLFIAVVPPNWPDLTARPFNRYVRGILAMGGRPVPLAPGEIDRIKSEDGRLAAVTALHRAFVPGQQARVIAGAWRDYEAAIEAIDENGARITVQLLGRPAEVTLPLTWLEGLAA